MTVQILYEGKTADSAMSHKSEFDDKVNELAEQHVASQMRKAENVETLRRIANREKRTFDDLVKERTVEEILALKKKWGTSDDLFEAARVPITTRLTPKPSARSTAARVRSPPPSCTIIPTAAIA